jgi:hypothetical protein
MQARIDEREAELVEEYSPRSPTERTLLKHMARAEIREDVCHQHLIADVVRVAKSADDSSWDQNRREHIDNVAARLSRDPCRVSGTLLRSKHGVEWCVERWRGLGAAARAAGGLKEEQRQFALDLLGIEPLLRNHTEDVPAGDNLPAILALVELQMKRLGDRLMVGGELDIRDRAARELARHGQMPSPPDKTTRGLKSDEARAHKRYVWAFESFRAVRAGTTQGPIIDPETGKPVCEENGAGACAATRAPSNAQKPPASASPSPSTSGPGLKAAEALFGVDNRPIPVPPGLSEEEAELMMILVETLRRPNPDAGLDNEPIPPPSQPPPPPPGESPQGG